MKKKNFEYTFFVLLNIFLSSYMLSGIICLCAAIIIGDVLTYLLNNFITIKDDLDFSIRVSSYLLPIVSMLFKIIIFPLIYNIKSLNNINNFLEKFATNKRFLIKILLSVLIFDIIIYMFSAFFEGCKFIFNSKEILEDIKIVYLFCCGGVFPCYLFFLLWHKFTHRNKTEIAQNSIRAL